VDDAAVKWSARQPATKTADKNNGGQARQRRVNLRSIDNHPENWFHYEKYGQVLNYKILCVIVDQAGQAG